MSQDRWQEVKDKVEGLGLKLKLHLEQEHEEDGGDAAGDGVKQAQAAIEEMGAKLQDAVNSMGNAAKDPAIRSDLRDLGELLRDAMNETFSAVGAEVGGILKKTKGDMAAQGDAASEVAEAVNDAVDEATADADAATDAAPAEATEDDSAS